MGVYGCNGKKTSEEDDQQSSKKCLCKDNKKCQADVINGERGNWCVVKRFSKCGDKKPYDGSWYSQLPCEGKKTSEEDDQQSSKTPCKCQTCGGWNETWEWCWVDK